MNRLTKEDIYEALKKIGVTENVYISDIEVVNYPEEQSYYGVYSRNKELVEESIKCDCVAGESNDFLCQVEDEKIPGDTMNVAMGVADEINAWLKGLRDKQGKANCGDVMR